MRFGLPTCLTERSYWIAIPRLELLDRRTIGRNRDMGRRLSGMRCSILVSRSLLLLFSLARSSCRFSFVKSDGQLSRRIKALKDWFEVI